jgi:hypothetical protein
MSSFEVNGQLIITCEFCGGETGPQDDHSIMWPKKTCNENRVKDERDAEFCCGECCHRMGLEGELILPCGLCQLPVLGTPEMIAGHAYEYCSSCSSLLRRAGFEIAFDDRR